MDELVLETIGSYQDLDFGRKEYTSIKSLEFSKQKLLHDLANRKFWVIIKSQSCRIFNNKDEIFGSKVNHKMRKLQLIFVNEFYMY